MAEAEIQSPLYIGQLYGNHYWNHLILAQKSGGARIVTTLRVLSILLVLRSQRKGHAEFTCWAGAIIRWQCFSSLLNGLETGHS
jgi:hypothetical protein